jgi:hypothetical protein
MQKEKMMKRLLFVFVGLAVCSLSAFAEGVFDFFDSPSENSGDGQVVAEVRDLAEVPERHYLPRRNSNIERAGSKVYALPADTLSPEPERLPPPVYAISGVRGQEIREIREMREVGKNDQGRIIREETWEVVDIVIDLPQRVSFSSGILEGEDVSDWITNLPNGLEARAHKVKKGAKSIKIYISGTPTVTMRELIRVTIPGTYLSSGSSREFVSPTEEESFNSWKEGQIAEEAAE